MSAGISTGACATLETEQLICHFGTAIVDTTTSFQNSERDFAPGSEVHCLLNRIHDILHNLILNELVMFHIF